MGTLLLGEHVWAVFCAHCTVFCTLSAAVPISQQEAPTVWKGVCAKTETSSR